MSECPGRRWRDGEAWHIDVRGLAPPQPLVAVLRLVEALAAAAPVVVHLDRDPVLLYPELAERGWTALRIDGEPGEVLLWLCPPGSRPPAGLEPAGDDPPSCLDRE